MKAGAAEPLRTLLHDGVGIGDVLDVLIHRRRRTVLLVAAPALLAAALWVRLPRWYESGATLTVDAGTTALPVTGAVLGLASQLGITAGSPGTSAQFYSDLLSSRVILEHVLAARFALPDTQHSASLEEFWNQGKPIDARSHARALRRLEKHFATSANPRTAVITLKVQGPSRSVAKLMADTALAALNDLVIAIRRRRAAEERKFLESRWKDLRDSLSAREDDLRRFYERNRQITSPQLQFEELRLRREVDRVQGVFVQVGTQLEQARIQEVRDIPVISVIDPPIEPVRKASPKLRRMLLTAAVIGGLMAITAAMFDAARGRLLRQS